MDQSYEVHFAHNRRVQFESIDNIYLGDYNVGETLMRESASIISFAGLAAQGITADGPDELKEDPKVPKSKLIALSSKMMHLRKHDASVTAPEKVDAVAEAHAGDFAPRCMIILAVGIKPFQKLWIEPTGPELEGMVEVFYEFLDLCVVWDRVETEKGKEKDQRVALKEVIQALLEADMRTKECEMALKILDPQRIGVAMWRIP
ncbi:hypothetical protein J3R30DRAFT_3698267 [Lentinula aciculospora]|uniref:Uncharacterized protein n=1 Tax=Lentinula aciculospora TaxID=153920 RepID=A0A9W9AIR5_9AGAR|nr:hypothetical protein J3R30DRAFT_3698267 [Lentinula aciculospora]